MRASKICSEPGCINLTPCPDHQRKPWANSNRRQQLPRGWSHTIVPRILARDPICTVCHNRLSTEVHHVNGPTDHRDDNLAGLCKDCHKAETQKQSQAARR